MLEECRLGNRIFLNIKKQKTNDQKMGYAMLCYAFSTADTIQLR